MCKKCKRAVKHVAYYLYHVACMEAEPTCAGNPSGYYYGSFDIDNGVLF